MALFTCSIVLRNEIFVFQNGVPADRRLLFAVFICAESDSLKISSHRPTDKYRQLKELLVSIPHLPMEQQEEMLQRSPDSWKGAQEQGDDITIVGVRVGDYSFTA